MSLGEQSRGGSETQTLPSMPEEPTRWAFACFLQPNPPACTSIVAWHGNGKHGTAWL